MSKALKETAELINLITGYDKHKDKVKAEYVKDPERLRDCYSGLYNLKHSGMCDKDDKEYYLRWSKALKGYCRTFFEATLDKAYDELFWQYMLFEAPEVFESYLFYTESKRDPKKQFYLPRYNTLKWVVQDLQDLEDGKYDFYGLSLPPRVGKSTLCLFFMSWHMGRQPNSHNGMSGHSQILADGFYDECLNLMGPEYRFAEVFPTATLRNKSAEKKEILLGDPDRFATLTCRGIEGTWTGAVDISSDGILYVDDLIRDREESLSPIRLEKRYQDYLNVLVDRKNDGARELMVGTRWNVLDPLGRIEEKFADNPRYLFRRIPALNDNDKSNFEYKFGKGFSSKYYRDIRARLDNNEWQAKYQQKPYVREGLLFENTGLRYYNGVLPDGDCRAVAVTDVAWGGGDSLSMPIGMEYDNGDVYIFDWVFNRGVKEVTIPIVVGKIVENGIKMMQFEANNGGDMYCEAVDTELRKNNYRCSCSHKRAPSTMAKMTKIIAASGDIKRRFLFLEPAKRSQEYREAMDELVTFVQIGKNLHDDAADSLAQLVDFIDNNGRVAKSTIMSSPF